jgi:KRAB domain-containing zinc finger protein
MVRTSSPLCNYSESYKSFLVLKEHIRRVHSTNTTKIQCDQCSALLKDIRTLRSHKKSKHANVKLIYECRFCDHKANSFCSRRYHERTLHENGTKHPCLVCDKSFLTPGRLERHLIIHTNERNFECLICRKCFKRKCQLDHHTQSHTSVREICPICKQEFMSKKTCKTHVQRVHGSNVLTEQLTEREQDEGESEVEQYEDDTVDEIKFEIE